MSLDLARRLDAADRVIVEIKRELESGKRPGVIAKAVDKLEKLFNSPVANSIDYPFLFPIH